MDDRTRRRVLGKFVASPAQDEVGVLGGNGNLKFGPAKEELLDGGALRLEVKVVGDSPSPGGGTPGLEPGVHDQGSILGLCGPVLNLHRDPRRQKPIGRQLG